MTKKTILAYIVLLGCIVLLAGSYLKWKDKLSSFQEESAPVAKNDDSMKKEETVTDPVKESSAEDKREHLLKLISDQDEHVQEVFLNRFDADEDLNFLIIGSAVLEDGQPGYAERLDNALKKAYGEMLQTTIVPFDDTIDQLMNNRIDELELTNGYDVILFEPLTLKNNGIVAIEDEQEHIKHFIEKMTDSVEDAAIVLHPPQPVHQATYYPTQVNALQTFAKANDIPYINHWADWPDSDSDELLDYLNEDGDPNNEGADIWANALIDYFIAEKVEEE